MENSKQIYIALSPYSYGKGNTPENALQEARERLPEGAKIKPGLPAYILLKCHPDTKISLELGVVACPGNHVPEPIGVYDINLTLMDDYLAKDGDIKPKPRAKKTKGPQLAVHNKEKGITNESKILAQYA